MWTRLLLDKVFPLLVRVFALFTLTRSSPLRRPLKGG
jgi:hypothetical protein